GEYRVVLPAGAMEHLLDGEGGDARPLVNGLDLAGVSTGASADGIRYITPASIVGAAPHPLVGHDQDGDEHHTPVSAFIKSWRGSDPDAALFYLARMLAAGEDPRFIARRMIIAAAEDVGNADPRALTVAVAAAQALEMVGLPEGRIPLAQATLYLATAPKSNAAYWAINRAAEDVKNEETGGVPRHLRDSSHPGTKAMGHGKGYLYPHDFPGHYVEQQYLPDRLQGRVYYEPADQGYEKEI